MLNLANERILLTGGTGFLGSHVVDTLVARGCKVGHLHSGCGSVGIGFLNPNGYTARGEIPHWATEPRKTLNTHPEADPAVWLTHSREHDLTDQDTVRGLLYDLRPTVVIHLAALCGGIGANRERPGEFYYQNLVMGAHLMEYARLAGAKKFVAIGTICAYPKYAPVPFTEHALWEGYPEETNAPYGLAKKMLLVQAQAYRDQYGFNAIYLLPVNLYGPRDNFDPQSSHVIPALIRKFLEAKAAGEPEVVVWGSGSATREFLYVPEAAEGIVRATESYDSPDPVNLGAGFEVSIRYLADTIRELTGYPGAIRWDRSKPDGQPRRSLDTSRAKTAFGFQAQTQLRDGLAATIQWYLEQQPEPTP